MHMNTAGAFKSDMQLSRTWSELWRAICIYFQIICSPGIWIHGLGNEKWEYFRLTSTKDQMKKGEYFFYVQKFLLWIWNECVTGGGIWIHWIGPAGWRLMVFCKKVWAEWRWRRWRRWRQEEGGQATGLVRTYETCMPPLLFSFNL